MLTTPTAMPAASTTNTRCTRLDTRASMTSPRVAVSRTVTRDEGAASPSSPASPPPAPVPPAPPPAPAPARAVAALVCLTRQRLARASATKASALVSMKSKPSALCDLLSTVGSTSLLVTQSTSAPLPASVTPTPLMPWSRMSLKASMMLSVARTVATGLMKAPPQAAATVVSSNTPFSAGWSRRALPGAATKASSADCVITFVSTGPAPSSAAACGGGASTGTRCSR
mmetsp:Transcript_54889/g.152000  ORF Transcript_54889/g.152000 Transcript_54889/m.152000 type:complete len:228 (-) Transcript_54889:387-1070(-)